MPDFFPARSKPNPCLNTLTLSDILIVIAIKSYSLNYLLQLFHTHQHIMAFDSPESKGVNLLLSIIALSLQRYGPDTKAWRF